MPFQAACKRLVAARETFPGSRRSWRTTPSLGLALPGDLPGPVVVKLAPSDPMRNGAPPARKAESMTTFIRPLAIKLVLMTTVQMGATACGNTWGQRAVTGGAIGAGAGAGLGAVTGIGILPGAIVGGAVGAGVGAATTPEY